MKKESKVINILARLYKYKSLLLSWNFMIHYCEILQPLRHMTPYDMKTIKYPIQQREFYTK